MSYSYQTNMAGVCLGLSLCLTGPAIAQTVPQSRPGSESHQFTITAASLEQEGKDLFEAGKLQQAVITLQQAITTYQTAGDSLGVAIASSNLALVYGRLGQWSSANQAIASSLNILQHPKAETGHSATLGQVLVIYGQLQLSQGRSRSALEIWQQAEATFTDIGDQDGVVRSQINQAQALQVLGLSLRAIDRLKQVTETLEGDAPSHTQVLALRSLGDTLRVVGELDEALMVLNQSLAMAEQLQLPEAVAAAQLSLGNTHKDLANVGSSLGNTRRDQKHIDAALAYYQQAAQGSDNSLTHTQAQLNRLSLFVTLKRWPVAQALWSPLLLQSGEWVPNRQGIDAQINLAHSLIRLQQGTGDRLPTVETIAQLLIRAHRQAQALGDPLAESYALGTLGSLYQQSGQDERAEALTQQALVIAQANNAPEILFRWQWQLGRILKAQGQRKSAIAAYSEAIQTLQSLRTDLIATTPKVQFEFRDNAEPIHRQLVELLLELETQQPNPDNLEEARLTIESLQLAELDNFFRQACLDANPVLIDEIDRQAAVIYPIILPDQLAVIVSLPGKKLRFHSTPISEEQVEFTVDRLQLSLGQRNSPRDLYLPLAQNLYDWLLRSAVSDLAQSEVTTLVFVLDGVLRNVPMAVLHDGDRYLVERYGIALTPGLQLLEPRPLQTQQLNVLAAGVSEPTQGFGGLPHVNTELEQINAQFPSQMIRNQGFTRSSIRNAVSKKPFPVVHLATHGKFSSELDETFLLTWKDRLTVDQLRSLLRSRELRRSGAIELLVLSACETAVGDNRAALGLAGIATRSGARSTLATLWQVHDKATAQLMSQFYQLLAAGNMTKAKALQQAQQLILQDPQYQQHPYFWSAYVLVGNWL